MVESVRIQLERQADRDFESTDVLKCVIGLNPLEIDIFMAVMEEYREWKADARDRDDARRDRDDPRRDRDWRGLTVKQIARFVGKDRTTVQRGVKQLRELGLLVKEDGRPKSRKSRGGLVYLYRPMALPDLKRMIQESLDAWYQQMQDFIEEFAL